MGFKRLEKNLIDIIKKNRQNLDFERRDPFVLSIDFPQSFL